MITQFLALGIHNGLTPYDRHSVRIFNWLNLAAFAVTVLRLLYLALLSPNDYPLVVLAVNAFPILICIAMATLISQFQFAAAKVVSFISFPQALVLMNLFTGDTGTALYLFLYFMFSFFFLHKIRTIVPAFIFVVLCFVVVQFSREKNFLEWHVFDFPFDRGLAFITYITGFAFIFLTLFIIKSEIWQFQKSLSKKRAQLQQLNTVKDKIFSVISHDLQTPVMTNIQLLKLMESKSLTTEEFHEMLPQMRKSMEETSSLLGSLLEWARSQIQQTTVNLSEVSVACLTEETIAFLHRYAEEKKIRLINDVKFDCKVVADEKSVKIVLRNLITNAIKFTPSGGYVRITTKLEQGAASVLVEDNGIGIPLDKQKILFGESFFTNGTNMEKGNGLGLILCQDLIQKNGGSLFFTSQPGKGSTFGFTFPVKSEEQTSATTSGSKSTADNSYTNHFKLSMS